MKTRRLTKYNIIILFFYKILRSKSSAYFFLAKCGTSLVKFKNNEITIFGYIIQPPPSRGALEGSEWS